MSHAPAGTAFALLKKRGFCKKDQSRLWAIADRVMKCGRVLTDAALDRMAVHFAGLGHDVEAFTLAALADGSWVDLVKDLAAEAPEVAAASTTNSSLSYVSQDNPYGWSTSGPNGRLRLEAMRKSVDRQTGLAWDHDAPGKWNAYRQSFNMTQDEAQARAAPDCRYRGCTRVEVLGGISVPPGWRPGMPIVRDAIIKQPKVFFDHVEVADAMIRGNHDHH